MGLLLLAALLLGLIFRMQGGTGTPADVVVARVDGETIGTWALAKDGVYDLDTKYGHNRLEIRDGAAAMTEADCPDGYCMEQSEISSRGGRIVCLPHHLVLTGEAGDEPENDDEMAVDAVAGSP